MNRTISPENQILHYSNQGNPIWKHDIFFPKNLYGLTKRFERSFDVDGSLIFASTKKQTMNKFLEKGLYPGVLMNEINLANEDYRYLKDLFKLE